MENNSHKKTIIACFIGYISQAIIVNFAPLLFLTFQKMYGVPIERISVLILINFGVQLVTDLLASKYVSRIGIRRCVVAAHIMCGVGLILMAFLPLAANPFLWIILSTVIYAVGGGLIEVLVSPLVEACPTDNKAGVMSILHSFYCWGVVGVVIISTVFFNLFGQEKWSILSVIWALVPLFNAVFFTRVPIYQIAEETGDKANYNELFKQRSFWVMMIIMLCAGASEQAISQWASTFFEGGLKISKTAGDLIGVCGFSLCMGISRALYGKFSESISIKKAMAVCAVLCVIGYLFIGLSGIAVFGIIGCIICGFAVGIFWPGAFSMATGVVNSGGTTMFALLALSGDLGCSLGPSTAGFMTSVFSGNMKYGLLCAVVFPMVLLMSLAVIKKNTR